jgi:hypothetical protein
MSRNLRLALCAVALVALGLPVVASAHPAMYTIQARLARPPEKQTITVDATGGTFKPSANAKTVPFNAPAWRVEDALGADPAIGRSAAGVANVLVSGNDGGPYTLVFQGTLAAVDAAQVVPDGSGLTGGTATAIATTNTQGGGANITYTSDPTGATMPLQSQAVIANDGFVSQWTESNGMADHGWLNLRFAPGAYRAPMTSSQWLNYGPAQTGIQTHATCQNVPALNTEANVLAVQNFFGQNAVGDPFWNYVPWQKTSSGLGDDDPDKWMDVVQTATGVDLSTLNTVAEFRAACEALNGGTGVYVPADTQGGNPASAAITEAVEAAIAPLNDQITALTAERDQLQADLDASEAARLALVNRPLKVTLQARRSSGRVVAMVTGPLNRNVKVSLRIAADDAHRLGVAVLTDSVTRPFGTTGAVLVTLTPSAGARRALAREGGAIDVTVRAVSGALTASKAGKLTR